MKSKQQIARIARDKRKAAMTIPLIIVFFGALLSALLLWIFLPDNEEQTPEKVIPEIIEGEALYNNYALAYPTMEESSIKRITIKGADTEYTLMRGTEGPSKGSFVLFYQDENGETQTYYPDIVEADSSFDFESLYSIEQNDGYNRIYKLTYLCVALEFPYFDERIPLDANEEEKAYQLRLFGLDEARELRFDYEEKNGEVKTRRILIGDKNPTGVGYYYMVSDGDEFRPYVYNSTANHYDYAFLGFASYINSMLVSKGLQEDSSYEPYLTTDFKHWVNEKYKEEGAAVAENSNVIIYTDMLVPLESTFEDEVPEANRDGYTRDGYDLVEFDLSKFKNKVGFERLVKALSNSKIGVFYDKNENIGTPLDQIIVTLTSDSKSVDFKGGDAVKYTYTITEIESILTDSKDIVDPAATVANGDKIRVAYFLSINGEEISDVPYHAVIDLSEAALPAGALELVGKNIGKLTSPVSFEIDYSEENSVPVDMKCKIIEIISVYDSTGKTIEKITETSIVTYRYVFVVNGVQQEATYTSAINLGTDETENGTAIKSKLIGRKADRNLNILAYEYTAHCEYLRDFITYEIAKIDSFVTSDIISSFRFQNSSERDPYYGESIYENTLENKYKIYGLNSAVCEDVVKILGGIGDTTGKSEGFVGTETVAI
ncbi:MAG: hypothetical protein J6Q68_00900, partial [Clostridia bacterium]|nr:hypothetical protein [Clostridia bacterium]